jgi:hypothetical protein
VQALLPQSTDSCAGFWSDFLDKKIKNPCTIN